MSTYKGFSQVELRKPKRSLFDLSHERKMSTRMGKLVPIFVSEALPNDTFKLNSEVMIRLAPLLAPIYHKVNCFVHHFFVPMRILEKEWENFITNGRLGTETPPEPPWIAGYDLFEQDVPHTSLVGVGSLADHLGMHPLETADWATWDAGGEAKYRVNARPFAGYYKIWYDYYRDRNYVADNDILPLSAGEISMSVDEKKALIGLKTRAWQHDYFTSALPWTQRGDDVLLPMEGLAQVYYKTTSTVRESSGGMPSDGPLAAVAGDLMETGSTPDRAVRIENIDQVTFQNQMISINDLRQSSRLQEWLERNAVAGSRYNESILAHFARRTSDGRLQRAEYLGGGRVNVQISEVMTTAFSEDADANIVPPATMTGRGITYNANNKIVYNCEEHGFVYSILSVMPTSAYMQGGHRMFWSRDTFLDYPWPSFANLGEQPVYTYELVQTAGNVPNWGDEGDTFEEPTTFGYQSRYADWKYMYSSVHGEFRTTLDYWHLARKFDPAPTLGNTFVTFEDELQDRVFAVSDVDTLWCYIYNNVSVVRSLPYFGTPKL